MYCYYVLDRLLKDFDFEIISDIYNDPFISIELVNDLNGFKVKIEGDLPTPFLTAWTNNGEKFFHKSIDYDFTLNGFIETYTACRF